MTTGMKGGTDVFMTAMHRTLTQCMQLQTSDPFFYPTTTRLLLRSTDFLFPTLVLNPLLNIHPSRQLILGPEILEHRIHLLQTSSRSFGNEEISPYERKSAEYSEEYVGSESSILYQRRRNEANDEIIEPI